jgi:flagellar biosynthetic protein FliQ
MEVNDVLQVAREGMWLTLILAGPMMAVGLAIGLVVSAFQALTQIQEMTLVFVPKLAAIFVVFILTLPFMFAKLTSHAEELSQRIVAVGTN